MEDCKTTRWFLKRLHQNEFKIVNIGSNTDISRSLRSVIKLDKKSFQHISKCHCSISCRNGVATLTDDSSSTGTYVNDRMFSKHQPGSVELAEGDLIGIGTPCNKERSYYEANSQVLLFQLCRDRNRPVVEEVETLLSDDEEEEVERKPVIAMAKERKEQEVPQRDERKFRILQKIDLSSDEEEQGLVGKTKADSAAKTSVMPVIVKVEGGVDGSSDGNRKSTSSEDSGIGVFRRPATPPPTVISDEEPEQFEPPQEARTTSPETIDLVQQESDEMVELFQDSYNMVTGEQQGVISIDDSEDDADEEDFSEQRLTQSFYRRIKQEAQEVENEPEPEAQDELPTEQAASPVPEKETVYNVSDSEEEDEEETSLARQWCRKLSQRVSPVRSKVVPQAKPEPPATKRTFSEMTLAGIEPIEDPDDKMASVCDDLQLLIDTDAIASSASAEAPETKRLKPTVKQPEPPTPLAKPPAEKLTSPASHEKNSCSASNAWISKKVPMVEPHHIQKYRKNLSSVKHHDQIRSSSSKKFPKPDKHVKHSPVRRVEGDVKEARKKKLKEIQLKNAHSSDASGGTKTATKPKVKYTHTNRGAFLTSDMLVPPKPMGSARESVPHFDDGDIVCTQSTALDLVQPAAQEAIDIPVTRAPKLTFDNVAKVSRVAQDAKPFKIPKRRPSVSQKPNTETSISTILSSLPEPAPKRPSSPVEIDELPMPPGPLPEWPTQVPTFGLKSVLKSPAGLARKAPKKRVTWKEQDMVETREYEIDEGNCFVVQTKYCKEQDLFCDMSLVTAYQNDIIREITGWDANWFDNPEQANVTDGQLLLPMVEEYNSFEDYKRIVMPILKLELFHDIMGQYGELKKISQKPLQMKVNQVRTQGQTFVLNCSVESNNHQSINNKDYVLIHMTEKTTGKEFRVPGVVTTRRQQVQYAAENGLKFFHCSLETARTPMSQRIRDGSVENYRILSLTQINLHMRQFLVLLNLENSPLLDNILSPRSNFYNSRTTEERAKYKGKEGLNREQGDILLSVFGHCLDASRPHIMLIQGPPGTGKSRLISNLVLQLHRGVPDAPRRMKILICAQSNTAIDVIVLKLVKLFRLLSKDEQGNVLRTGTANKVNQECKMVFLDTLARRHVNELIKCRKLRDEDPSFETFYLERESLERKLKLLEYRTTQGGKLAQNSIVVDEIMKLRDRLEKIKRVLPDNVDNMDLQDKERWGMESRAKKQLVSKADIICTTLGSCGGLFDYYQSLKFDVCIIDEATQCTEISSFTPLQYGVKKLILVGDIKQLPPFVFSRECAEAGLKNSLFARIQQSFVGTNLEGVKMLTTQYRMHPEIVKWPNEYFYEGKLKSNPEATKCDGFPFKPYTVFGLEYSQNMTQSAHQIYNHEEIEFVLKLLTEIMQCCHRHTTIAIITPYTRHKREIEKFLAAKKITQVSVLSIDSVQGQEYDVVIISLARSVGTGFLGSPQRLNVALTRARKCLILCGNFADLKDNNVWSSLLEDAEKRKLYYPIADDDEYDDVNTFVNKVMHNLKK
uniref:FHA domain-containing protein n=1 Tax=Culex tarsalis TaxID=7177 RepID=A0A1Q3G116_CULTA